MAIDPEGKRWLTAEHLPVKVDIAEWHEYTVIANETKTAQSIRYPNCRWRTETVYTRRHRPPRIRAAPAKPIT